MDYVNRDDNMSFSVPFVLKNFGMMMMMSTLEFWTKYTEIKSMNKIKKKIGYERAYMLHRIRVNHPSVYNINRVGTMNMRTRHSIERLCHTVIWLQLSKMTQGNPWRKKLYIETLLHTYTRIKSTWVSKLIHKYTLYSKHKKLRTWEFWIYTID